MNQLQKDYLKARATYDTVVAEIARIEAPYEHLIDTDIEAFCEATAAGVEALDRAGSSDALTAAEEALLDWSFNAAIKIASPEQAALLTETRGKLARHYIQRQEAIELAMRLKV